MRSIYYDSEACSSLDTASFELFRLACTSFYKELSSQEERCIIEVSEDRKRRAGVQQTYKVRRIDDTPVYTLNLYPTKNTMLLNGKDIDRFMTEHLPVIHELMCKAMNDMQLGSVSDFNRILSTELQRILQQREGVEQATSDCLQLEQRAESPTLEGRCTQQAAVDAQTHAQGVLFYQLTRRTYQVNQMKPARSVTECCRVVVLYVQPETIGYTFDVIALLRLI